MSGTTSGVDFSHSGDGIHMKLYRGKTPNFEIIWGGSTPIDVSGYEASLQIRDLNNALMLEMSTANGKITVGGTDGKFTFSASSSETSTINSVGKWELELTAPGGDVYRALSGTLTPIEEIVK